MSCWFFHRWRKHDESKIWDGDGEPYISNTHCVCKDCGITIEHNFNRKFSEIYWTTYTGSEILKYMEKINVLKQFYTYLQPPYNYHGTERDYIIHMSITAWVKVRRDYSQCSRCGYYSEVKCEYLEAYDKQPKEYTIKPCRIK